MYPHTRRATLAWYWAFDLNFPGGLHVGPEDRNREPLTLWAKYGSPVKAKSESYQTYSNGSGAQLRGAGFETPVQRANLALMGSISEVEGICPIAA